MSVKYFQNKKTSEKGFLLPDVMIAVFVTVTTLVVIIAVLAPLFKSEFFKRDEIIATGLAQEGIELVRNMRDNNWKATPSVDAFRGLFPVNNSNPGRCTDYLQAALGAFPVCNNNNEHLSPNGSGLYISGSSGKFIRKINISDNGSGSVNRKVDSSISWTANGVNHTVTLTDILTPWGDK
jgi:hypothetical protein